MGKKVDIALSLEKEDNFFGDSVLDLMPEKDFIDIINNTNKTVGAYINTIKDFRLLLIVCVSVLEDDIENILKCFLPNYRVFTKNHEITFSHKIDLLISLNVIPKYITSAIHRIRKARNLVAHNIDINFDVSLLDSHIDAFKSHLKTLSKGTWSETGQKINCLRDLVLLLLICLKTYGFLFEKYNEHIRSSEFLDGYKAHQNIIPLETGKQLNFNKEKTDDPKN